MPRPADASPPPHDFGYGHAVEIRFAQPVGRRLHAAGDFIGDLRHTITAHGDIGCAGGSAQLPATTALT